MAIALYEIQILDTFGNEFGTLLPSDIVSLQYSVRDKEIGALTLVVRGNRYPREWFTRWNNKILIWRTPANGQRYLELSTAWLLKNSGRTYRGGRATYTIQAMQGDTFLSDRVTAYFTGASQVSVVSTPYDDVIKQMWRDNFGATANTPPGSTGLNRDLSSYVTIDPNLSLANSASKDFSWRDVFDVTTELCNSSFAEGTYLVPIVEYNPNSGKFVVGVRKDQRHADRQLSSAAPFLIDADMPDNFVGEVSYSTNYAEVVTFAYGVGQGQRDSRVVVMGYNNTLLKENPFGRVEAKVDMRNLASSQSMKDELKAFLTEHSPRTQFRGQLNTNKIKYEQDLHYGDRVTVVKQNEPTVNPRFNALSVSVAGSKEDITIVLEDESVADFEFVFLDYNADQAAITTRNCGVSNGDTAFVAEINDTYTYTDIDGSNHAWLSAKTYYFRDLVGSGSAVSSATPSPLQCVTSMADLTPDDYYLVTSGQLLIDCTGANHDGSNYWQITYFNGSTDDTTTLTAGLSRVYTLGGSLPYYLQENATFATLTKIGNPSPIFVVYDFYFTRALYCEGIIG